MNASNWGFSFTVKHSIVLKTQKTYIFNPRSLEVYLQRMDKPYNLLKYLLYLLLLFAASFTIIIIIKTFIQPNQLNSLYM